MSLTGNDGSEGVLLPLCPVVGEMGVGEMGVGEVAPIRTTMQ